MGGSVLQPVSGLRGPCPGHKCVVLMETGAALTELQADMLWPHTDLFN